MNYKGNQLMEADETVTTTKNQIRATSETRQIKPSSINMEINQTTMATEPNI